MLWGDLQVGDLLIGSAKSISIVLKIEENKTNIFGASNRDIVIWTYYLSDSSKVFMIRTPHHEVFNTWDVVREGKLIYGYGNALG